MTKNGSNAHKARIRAHAAVTGQTYRKAALSIESDDERAQAFARRRAAAHAPEKLVEIREVYLSEMLRSDLPDMVKACLYVLADRFGAGRWIDPYVAHCTEEELAEATVLGNNAVDYCIGIAEGLRWMTDFHDSETRLTIPGEDAAMYLRFLQDDQTPVKVASSYQVLQERIVATVADHEADRAVFLEAMRRTVDRIPAPAPQ